jgi:putative component of toxin-antitoxin plasmid stabilization module
MGSGRYVQYQVSLRPDATAQQTPRLKRVRLGWPGDVKIVGISGIATRGPDYGIYEVSVDNTPLVRSVRIDLTIFKDVMSKSYSKQRITSTMLAEVEPRNTGK